MFLMDEPGWLSSNPGAQTAACGDVICTGGSHYLAHASANFSRPWGKALGGQPRARDCHRRGRARASSWMMGDESTPASSCQLGGYSQTFLDLIGKNKLPPRSPKGPKISSLPSCPLSAHLASTTSSVYFSGFQSGHQCRLQFQRGSGEHR